MFAIIGTQPTIADGIINFPLNPGATITDSTAIAVILSGCAAKFDGPQRLRIANVAKNDFSYAHKMPG
jgi:hypothetical protein